MTEIDTALEYREEFKLWMHSSKRKGELTHQILSLDGINVIGHFTTKYYFKVLISTHFHWFQFMHWRALMNQCNRQNRCTCWLGNILNTKWFILLSKLCVVLDVIYMKPQTPCQPVIYWIPDLSIVLFLKFRFMSSNAMIFVYSNDLPKNVYEMIIAFCPHLNKYF